MLFSHSVFSLLGRGLSSLASRRFLSSINVSPPEHPPSDIDLANFLPSRFQNLLTDRNRAPNGGETFVDLRQNPVWAFRDFTPFFEEMDIFEPSTCSHAALFRGRRWGKSVLGQGWLAFLRKEEHLFKGTAVEGKMRKEPLMGIELDLSGCSTISALPLNLSSSIQGELIRLRHVGHKIPEWPSGLLSDSLPPSRQMNQVLQELVNAFR